MNQKQRENVAKYLYDCSKLILSIAVIGNLLSLHKNYSFDLLWGALSGPVFFLGAYFLDGWGVQS